MQLEIRQAKPEEMVDFKRVAKAALMVNAEEHLTYDLTLCGFIDGKMVTSYAAWPLTVVMNGRDVPTAGITMVGTLPVARRLGALRKVTTRHFEILHEEGKRPVSALYASRAAIYRRYGYSPVVTNNTYTVEPRYLQFVAGKEPAGRFIENTNNDISVIAELYDSFIDNRTAYLRRTQEMWQRRLNPPARDNREQYKIIYEEDGKKQGYVIYTTTLIQEGRNRFSQNIFINDLVWQTPSAYRALWEFFYNMDVVIEITRGQASSDDPLPMLLQEPRMLSTRSSDGLYARIIDVSNALPQRGYDEKGKLTFRIMDTMCPWNEGIWELETSSSGSMIKHSKESPQLDIPISTLALIYFGQISATEAARMGRLNVNEPNCLPVWDRVMRTKYKPACADGF
jgi:predicted acetyltransferase